MTPLVTAKECLDDVDVEFTDNTIFFLVGVHVTKYFRRSCFRGIVRDFNFDLVATIPVIAGFSRTLLDKVANVRSVGSVGSVESVETRLVVEICTQFVGEDKRCLHF